MGGPLYEFMNVNHQTNIYPEETMTQENHPQVYKSSSLNESLT